MVVLSTGKCGREYCEGAVEAGIEHVLHLSVVGAYRWSPNPLNRATFESIERFAS